MQILFLLIILHLKYGVKIIKIICCVLPNSGVELDPKTKFYFQFREIRKLLPNFLLLILHTKIQEVVHSLSHVR